MSRRKRVLDRCENSSPFVFQAAMDGAWRKMEAGRLLSSRLSVVGQCGAQQVAHADDHFAVAPVERRDLARRAIEEGGEGGFVAADRQIEQVGIEAGDQRADTAGSVETGILGEDQGVVVGMLLVAMVGKDRTLSSARPRPASQQLETVQQTEQPFEGEDAAGRVVYVPLQVGGLGRP
jgi:hypothetical protein